MHVMVFIIFRAFCEFEFEEVRKLSAELCGRIHPQVIFSFMNFLERHPQAQPWFYLHFSLREFFVYNITT